MDSINQCFCFNIYYALVVKSTDVEPSHLKGQLCNNARSSHWSRNFTCILSHQSTNQTHVCLA